MKKLKIAIIGLGNRGTLYTNILKKHLDQVEFVACVDFKIEEQIKNIKDVKFMYLYNNTDSFFKANHDIDLLIISSMDQFHYANTIDAINHKYNILLEKPIATRIDEINEIEQLARHAQVNIFVCHVLRYTMFYKEIKRLIDEGTLGEIVNINSCENVAYWHHLHSYVRGNWHNTIETAPMILCKCSHDLDIVKWLMDKEVDKVSSFGSNYYFKKSNKPLESSNRCFDCKLNKDCDYNCYKFYMKNREWLIPFMGNDLSDDNIDKFLRASDFGRCAFDMDNDTVDHQLVNILFKDGTTASHTMNSFSKYCYRDIHVFGTKGDLIGNFMDQMIHVNLYNDSEFDINIKDLTDDLSGHGGGDALMIKELLDFFEKGIKTKSLTTLGESIISHKMAFLSESSRLNNGNSEDVK